MSTKKSEFFYDDTLEEMADDLKVLGHPQRLKIIDALRALGEMNVSEIVRKTKLSQTTVSQHLSKMKATNLVICRRDSRQVVYWISTEIAFVVAECLNRKVEGTETTS